jgi:uncharacterized protein YqjF (DUF2071 family)
MPAMESSRRCRRYISNGGGYAAGVGRVWTNSTVAFGKVVSVSRVFGHLNNRLYVTGRSLNAN